jgi:hypothetical protein
LKTHDVQNIEIAVPFAVAVKYISDCGKLPEWAAAFKEVSPGKAKMATPNGAVDVDLKVDTSACGSIDWTMVFPDQSVGKAYSRVVALGPRSVSFVFVLTAPPVPLAQIEGALEQQMRILREELKRLKGILEGGASLDIRRLDQ